MMKDIKEVAKNAGNKVGGFVKKHRGKIAFAAGIGIGSYVGLKSGATGFAMAIKLYVPEAWEIITKQIDSQI